MKVNKLNKILVVAVPALLLTACSSHYVVPEGAASNQIFQEACSSCHKGKEFPENYFKISANNRNIGAISHKIGHGGLMMPAYPNITGRTLHELSQYVLNHSVVK
jgi:mono/diheme cytochrome c family protein